MRTRVILSSIWLGGVLALASVQAAETAPALTDPALAAQANSAVVVTLQNLGGQTQATVTQQGDAAAVVEGLTVQVQTAAAPEPAPAAQPQPAAAEQAPAATPAPPATAPAATKAPAGATPSAPIAPGTVRMAPAARGASAGPGAATMQRSFDAGAAGRRRFQGGRPPAFTAGRQTPTATRPGPAVSPQAVPFDSYQVLSDRNIFSRVRTGERVVRIAPPPTPPERYLVLRGILGGENGYLAFIEDTRSGDTPHYQAGDAIGQGRITAISRDSLTYEHNGTVTKVAIGDYVGGAPPAGSAPASPAAQAAPEAAASGAASDVLERLRQRRLKEEGK